MRESVTGHVPFEHAAKQVLATYLQSVSQGDLATWISLWDEEGIQLPPGSPMRVGRAAIEQALARDFASFVYYDSAYGSISTLVDHDYGFAWGTAVYKCRARASGQVRHIDMKFETIFRRQADGSWKIYRDCFNSNVPS